MSIESNAEVRLSVPARTKLPRALSGTELLVMRAVADVLVPTTTRDPGATEAPGFDGFLEVALNARVDAFDAITEALSRLDATDSATLRQQLESMWTAEPGTFQALSAVVVESWLLAPEVRERIGYHGQRRELAPVDQGTNEVTDGILDPVLERDPIYRPTP